MKINNRVDAYDVEAARAAISSSEMFMENVEEVYISDSAYSGFMIFLLTFLPKAKVKSPLDLGREFARVGLYGNPVTYAWTCTSPRRRGRTGCSFGEIRAPRSSREALRTKKQKRMKKPGGARLATRLFGVFRSCATFLSHI